MSTILLSLDNLDSNICRVYAVQTYRVMDSVRRQNLLVSTMHVDVVDWVFGEGVEGKLLEQGEIQLLVENIPHVEA